MNVHLIAPRKRYLLKKSLAKKGFKYDPNVTYFAQPVVTGQTASSPSPTLASSGSVPPKGQEPLESSEGTPIGGVAGPSELDRDPELPWPSGFEVECSS